MFMLSFVLFLFLSDNSFLIFAHHDSVMNDPLCCLSVFSLFLLVPFLHVVVMVHFVCLGALCVVIVLHLPLLRSSDNKFLIFAHHVAVMNEIDAALKEEGVNFIRIDGTTPALERHNYVDAFQVREEGRGGTR